MVAPHAGAWIETGGDMAWDGSWIVAPHAGAWIETYCFKSLHGPEIVAPHAGAWIETRALLIRIPAGHCRPPRGGVD